MRRIDGPVSRGGHPAALIDAAQVGGQPLDPGLRRILEHSFGLDLTAIRTHVDPLADGLARTLRADAFAAGAHIFFREEGYQPHTEAGLKLLAHEVAHTIQQAQGAVSRGGAGLNQPDGPWETQADHAAGCVLAGQRVILAAGLDAVRPRPLDHPLVLQRHESYEHRALGDIPTSDIYAIAANQNPSHRKEILERETKLMRLWAQKPEGVSKEEIAKLCPWIRTVRLQPSDLLVTYGELNALPDYIAQAQAIDTCPRDVLLPLLQAIRQESFERLNALRGVTTSVKFAHAPFAPKQTPIGFLNKLLATRDLDTLTRNLGITGIDHYGALLGRNACHFAPYTWHRWQASYLMACDYARRAHATGDPNEQARLTHLAWTYHGYADHFLQDSFAAGHLINKTLVMQWFVKWAASSSLPIVDWDVIKDLTVECQPNLAGRQLYDPSYAGPSTDPQTVEEQATYAERLALSGVVSCKHADQKVAYQQYLTFLSSVITQATTNAIHDHYNEHSLWVASKAHPAAYQVYGDDTLFSGKHGAPGPGAQLTSETAQLSQQSILELLDKGQTQITTQTLRDRFPTLAGDDHQVVPLQTWMDGKERWATDYLANSTGFLIKRIGASAFAPRIPNLSQDQEFWNKWCTSLPNSGFHFTDTAVSNGRLFAGSVGRAYELNPTNGDLLHSRQVSRSNDETHIATDGTTLFVGCYGYVHGIKLNDWSRIAWTTPMTGASYCSVHVLYANGKLFAGSNGAVHELNPASGQRLQSRNVSAAVAEEVRLATDGQTLFAGCHGYVHGIRLNDWSRIAWTTPMTGASYCSAQVLYANGKLFAGSNGAAHELSPATGQRLHSRNVSAAVGEEIRLATDGQTLFVGCHGYAYGIRLNDWSRIAWTTPMSGTLYDTVELLYANGYLYAGSNGYIHRLEASSGKMLNAQLQGFILGIGSYAPSLTLNEPQHGLFIGMHGYVYSMTQ